MEHRLTRRLAVPLSALVVVASLLGSTTGAAAASHVGPVRRVGHVDSLRSAAARPARAVSTDSPAFDARFFRSHQLEGQEPEGGEAVQRGEVAAPVARGAATVTISAAATGWEGSNHFDSRYSGGGNQFSGEPPDQGLCASGTRVFEIVNSVVQVYDTNGQALIDGTPFFPGTAPVGITLAEFFGQPPEVDRTNGTFGPTSSFDVSCKYDPSSRRWFVTAAFLGLDHTTGAFTGTGGVFIAASDSANPLKGWTIWTLDTNNNGQNGTPDHHCSSGACFGDYPQLGIDGSGLYITTNEFDLFGTGAFNGTQLYAFSKADLVAGAAVPTMTMIENVTSSAVDDVAYTVQPVDSIPASRDTRNGGTMYFGMSHSPYVEGNATAISLFRLTNTSSLATDHPSLSLQEASVRTEPYSVPAFALQKDGPTPLLQCENSFNCIGATYPHQTGPIPLDAGNAGKVYGAWLRRGVVYLTLGTNLAGPGGASFNSTSGKWKATDVHTGVVYVALKPSGGTSFSATRVIQGYVNVPGENLTFPAVAMNGAGAGAIGFTLVGPDYYPSGAYIRFGPKGPAGDVVVSGPGRGPNDGFSGYGDGGFDPRWGDYGAATVAPGGTVWLASEYINQSCTFAQWSADTTCGFTRTFLANWSTHITGLSP